jgi:hypothetical protein
MDRIMLIQVAAVVVTPLVFLLAIEIGYRLGRGAKEGKQIDTGPVQGAMLGLLGLLLAFSFAGSAGRFVDRQALVFDEANAIGTAYLRADLIDEPHAGDLRQTLREYTEHRTRIQGALLADTLDEFMSAVPAFHERMWAAARDGSLARPEVTEPVVNAVNDVIDMHTLRLAAYKHLQTPVLVLLLVCSVLTLGVIGYACGVGGSRNALMTTVIAVLIASTLLITVDLDNARVGLIRMSDAPLAELDLGG